MTAPRVATYRLQLTAEFGFDDAARVVPYLAALGVSHVYLSPVMQAAAGSTHGYDVVDPTTLSEELGGDAAWARLVDAAHAEGLAVMVDIVPNHMGADPVRNLWWRDVLRHGHDSEYARCFDVDWAGPSERIVLPLLGDRYGAVLERGEIRVEQSAGGPSVRYFEHDLPAAPGTADAPADGPEAVHAVLERQFYRLAYWRTADEEIDYRRFFDITSLVATRVERPDVFDRIHERTLELVASGDVDALRVDHLDGLADPDRYLQRLRAAAPDTWLVVEKILTGDEAAPRWCAEGTTGYEFAIRANALFVDPAGAAPLRTLYREFTGDDRSFDDVEWQARTQVLDTSLAADLRRVVRLTAQACDDDWRTRDFTFGELHSSIRAVAAALPIYRTYVAAPQEPDVAGGGVAPDAAPGAPAGGADGGTDAAVLRAALAAAAEREPSLAPDVWKVVGAILEGHGGGTAGAEACRRFQQLTPAVAAKGVEDTASYRYVPLAALNEVGGRADDFGATVESWHEWCADRQANWPYALSATTTHDTKRGEDVRCRLDVLSELPAVWAEAVARWSEHNAGAPGASVIDRRTEYLLYQTLVGAHPLDADRCVEYLRKACREAKEQTSWTAPDDDFEAGVEQFARAVLADDEFVAEVDALVARIEPFAWRNSLALTALKLAAPGVPDIYQGSEVWQYSLVDPDNRRAVDFIRLATLPPTAAAPAGPVARAADPSVAEPAAAPGDERTKLAVIRAGLALRRRRPECFDERGAYKPLAVRGDRAVSAVAFARGDAVACVVPRLAVNTSGSWAETTVGLPPGDWRDVVTGAASQSGEPSLRDLWTHVPVALLERG